MMVLLAAVAAGAAQPRIVFAPRRALEAGEVVTVGWEGLPSNVDELEFLLTTDDGETIRLTPQFMPSRRSFRWKVPNLPSRAAALELRVGIEGVEMVVAASVSFEIRGVAREAQVEFRDGEWWSVETGKPAAVPPAVQSVRRGKDSPLFVPPRQWLPRAGGAFGDAARVGTTAMTSSRVDTRCGAPLVVPQRK